MFKVVLAAVAVFAFTASAYANDSSVARITVKGIDPGSLQVNKDVKFYGENANTFFQMLPGIKLAESRQEQQKENAKHRHLSIASKGYTLELSCTTVSYDKNGNEMKNPNGTECRIALANPDPEYGDSFELRPPVCK